MSFLNTIKNTLKVAWLAYLKHAYTHTHHPSILCEWITKGGWKIHYEPVTLHLIMFKCSLRNIFDEEVWDITKNLYVWSEPF